MKKIKRICIAACMLFSFSGNAQTVPPVLQAMLDNTLDSMHLFIGNMSLSAGIQLSNTAIWSRASGISSVIPYNNVTTSDVYEIGSVTKTMTAACILQLADAGTLSLDDSLWQWMDDTITYINPDITIRQLLRHQSGLYDVLSNPATQPALLADQDSIWTASDLITTFIQPPIFAAGAGWSYCNTGYFLLGMIIEEATGNPFYQELRSRFFTPLAMNTIAMPAYEPLTSPVAHVWLDITGDGVPDDANAFYTGWLSLNSAAGAAGGYYATPSDIAKWMRIYMRGDLVSSGLMAQASTTVTAPGLPATTYGLGLMKKTFVGYMGIGHGGDLSYASSAWYFPAKDISIAVHTNDSQTNSWALAPVVAALLKTYNLWASATAVSELDNSLSLTAYPNPFKNTLSLSLHLDKPVSEMQFIITNALGEKVATLEKQNVLQGDDVLEFENLDQLTPGMYFVTAYAEGAFSKTIKVIK